jgi:hypothetical protein
VILVCHVGEIDHRVIGALAGRAVTKEIDPNEDTAYCGELEKAWAVCSMLEEDLTVVEHDIVVDDETIESFDSCDRKFCAAPYWIGGSTSPGLGCTRFRLSLIKEFPKLITDAGAIDDDLMIARHWRRLDTRVYRVLRENGVLPCVHLPAVEHLHEYPMRPEDVDV